MSIIYSKNRELFTDALEAASKEVCGDEDSLVNIYFCYLCLDECHRDGCTDHPDDDWSKFQEMCQIPSAAWDRISECLQSDEIHNLVSLDGEAFSCRTNDGYVVNPLPTLDMQRAWVEEDDAEVAAPVYVPPPPPPAYEEDDSGGGGAAASAASATTTDSSTPDAEEDLDDSSSDGSESEDDGSGDDGALCDVCIREPDETNYINLKCALCPGYHDEDGDFIELNDDDIGHRGCNLCGKTRSLVQMKPTGQVICQSACDESTTDEDNFVRGQQSLPTRLPQQHSVTSSTATRRLPPSQQQWMRCRGKATKARRL